MKCDMGLLAEMRCRTFGGNAISDFFAEMLVNKKMCDIINFALNLKASDMINL